MPKLFQAVVLCLALGLPAPTYSSDYDISETERIVDFYLFYPLASLKTGFTRTQVGTAGFGVNYYWYIWDRLGVVMNPNAWILRVRHVPTDDKGLISVIAMEGGLSFRFFPKNYFDPTLSALGGFGRAGTTASNMGSKMVFPLSGRLGANLYRTQERFGDPTLALHAFGAAKYYLSQHGSFKPLVFEFGLAFRGSF